MAAAAPATVPASGTGGVVFGSADSAAAPAIIPRSSTAAASDPSVGGAFGTAAARGQRRRSHDLSGLRLGRGCAGRRGFQSRWWGHYLGGSRRT